MGCKKKTAAKCFGVPRSTLQFRLSDQFRKTRHGPDTVLTTEEESLLVEWILDSYRKGFPRRKEDIQASVKNFLDDSKRPNRFKNNVPGDTWYKSFLKRHPNISIRTSEAVTQSSSCVSAEDLRKWFLDIKNYLKRKGYDSILQDPSRLFNGDETCFLLGPKETKVLAERGAKNVYEIDRAVAKANLTVMFTFSANGRTTPPMIIYPYKRLPPRIVESVPPDWGIGISDNGWMKAELFFEYVSNVLHPYLVKNNVTFPVILFVDGHKTHLTYQLSELCTKLQIVLIALYPNSTRILQPADVAAFKPIKNLWKKSVLEWRRNNPNEQLTKENFAPILKVVVDSINERNIISGFRACGLYPFDFSSIDISKCLGKIKSNSANESFNITQEKYLNYTKFCEEVGMERINVFRSMTEGQTDTTGKSEEFLILFELWKQFDKCNQNPNDVSSSIEPIEQFQLKESVENHLTPEELSYSIEDIPIIFADSILDTSPADIELTLDNSLIANAAVKDQEQNPNTTENVTNQEPRINILQNYLLFPRTPERKNKRNVEKLPYVITSTGWKHIYTEKKTEKDLKEKQKEERKRQRIENKKEKELKTVAKGRKQAKKTNGNIF